MGDRCVALDTPLLPRPPQSQPRSYLGHCTLPLWKPRSQRPVSLEGRWRRVSIEEARIRWKGNGWVWLAEGRGPTAASTASPCSAPKEGLATHSYGDLPQPAQARYVQGQQSPGQVPGAQTNGRSCPSTNRPVSQSPAFSASQLPWSPEQDTLPRNGISNTSRELVVGTGHVTLKTSRSGFSLAR